MFVFSSMDSRMSRASGSSDGGQGWPRYGPVSLIRCPKCERSESLVRLRSKRWENGNFGREFVKCESKPQQDKVCPYLPITVDFISVLTTEL